MTAAMVCSAAMRIAAAVLCALLSTCAAFAQSADAGRRQFELACSRCHGADGNGGEHGPGIVTRLFARLRSSTR
jgi:cytochrome c553